MSGLCLLCQKEGSEAFDHRPDRCNQRATWQNVKKRHSSDTRMATSERWLTLQQIARSSIVAVF